MARRAADVAEVVARTRPIFRAAKLKMNKAHAELSQGQPIGAKGEDLLDQLDEAIVGGLRTMGRALALCAAVSSPRGANRKR